jgi:hypothetical protein
MTEEAPDFGAPFIAWRAWKVIRPNGVFSLRSIVQHTHWPRREALTASCLRSRPLFSRLRQRPPHSAPHADCDCGVYATSLEGVEDYVRDASGRVACVIGQVALWGVVIECERGLRASTAYPHRIYVPRDAGKPWSTGWKEVALDLAEYGVPVEPLEASVGEATSVLTGRELA